MITKEFFKIIAVTSLVLFPELGCIGLPGDISPIDLSSTVEDQNGSGDNDGSLDSSEYKPTKNVGEACVSDRQCIGDNIYCVQWGTLGGYCTKSNCATKDDCTQYGASNVCRVSAANGSLCLRQCKTAADCRQGFICQKVLSSDNGTCVPINSEKFDAQFAGEKCVAVGKDSINKVEFDIPEHEGKEDTSYFINARSKYGSAIQFVGFQRSSDNSILNTAGEENRINQKEVRLSYTGYLAFLLPNAPKFSDFVRPGKLSVYVASYSDHDFSQTSNDVICLQLIEKVERIDDSRVDVPFVPNNLNLNIYLVGVSNQAGTAPLTSKEAVDDQDVKDMLGRIAELYGQQQIDIGLVRFIDAPKKMIDRYKIIRDLDDISEISKLSAIPDPKNKMTVNIFFIDRFVFQEKGVFGVSGGCPGLVGIHGTPGSGIVLSSEFLRKKEIETIDGEENQMRDFNGGIFTGHVIAHEIGHFLGLYHTTELDKQVDLLNDTPICIDDMPLGGQRIIKAPTTCPDFNNVMFPFILPSYVVMRDSSFSTQQGDVMKHNPLLLEAPLNDNEDKSFTEWGYKSSTSVSLIDQDSYYRR